MEAALLNLDVWETALMWGGLSSQPVRGTFQFGLGATRKSPRLADKNVCPRRQVCGIAANLGIQAEPPVPALPERVSEAVAGDALGRPSPELPSGLAGSSNHLSLGTTLACSGSPS